MSTDSSPMHRLLRTAAVALLPLLLVGCDPGGQGTDSGNAFQAALTVAGEGALVTGARDVASITSAELYLTEVELKPCADGGEDEEIDYEGEYTADLLGGTSLGAVDLGIDSVCSVETEADPPSGPTIRIEGTSTGGSPFLIQSEETWEWEIESEVALQQDVLNQLFLLFDLDQWLDGVDPDLGTPGGDGVILIDHDNNSDLLDAFEENVELTGSLEEDDDGDDA